MSTLPSLYERVLGEDFVRLNAAVQAFHRLQGSIELHGVVRTFAPQSMLARLVARGLGSPLHDAQDPFRFELDAQPAVERWTRHFPNRTMTSVLEFADGVLVERLGLARMRFELQVLEDGRLSMRLSRLRFAGIACPRWLMPHVIAQEWGVDNLIHFKVRASLPWGDVVAQYEGHLSLPHKKNSHLAVAV